MGCCLSTNSPTDAISLQKSATNGRSPPPASVEEETVKEVLSASTIVPKPPTSKLAQNTIANAAADTIKPQAAAAEHKIELESTTVIKPMTEVTISEVSEVSEMYSFTDSFSATTMTEKREDDGEVNQSVVESSPLKAHRKRPSFVELTRGRERGFRSPAFARSVPSPQKRSQVSSSPAQGRTIATPSNGLRRDPSEGSCRRSRSPVVRGEAGIHREASYKNRSLTPNGLSGERWPVGTLENHATTPENGESLENSLVSMECFIFL